ncbi:hypothetical protein ACA910_018688 [Epithemia clementina (nom. ined.)]
MTQVKMRLMWSSKRLLTTPKHHRNHNDKNANNSKRSTGDSTTSETNSRSSASTYKPYTDESAHTMKQQLEQALSSTAANNDSGRRKNLFRISRRSQQKDSTPLASDNENKDHENKNTDTRIDEVPELESELSLKPKRGRLLGEGVPKQRSIRDLSKYIRAVDNSPEHEEIELTVDETHDLIPGMLGFKSGHALINKERALHGRTRLRRSVYLDRLCQMHAKVMAESGDDGKGALVHSVKSTEELKELVNSDHAGENIQRGPSVESMHKETMSRPGKSAYKNILSENFTEFGMGTALGVDGKLYMAQLFRGQLRNPLQAKKGDVSNSLVFSEFLEMASFWKMFTGGDDTKPAGDSENDTSFSSFLLSSWSPFGRQRTESACSDLTDSTPQGFFGPTEQRKVASTS